MINDLQNQSGFENICCYPDWVYAAQPVIIGEEITQIVGQAGGNSISITGSVTN